MEEIFVVRRSLSMVKPIIALNEPPPPSPKTEPKFFCKKALVIIVYQIIQQIMCSA